MPWKETCAMHERLQMICELHEGELSVAELCRRYGISRKTGYKWIERYEEDGKHGLVDRSHAPQHCPHRVSPEIAEDVLAVRHRNPTWGPKKIRSWLDEHRPGRAWPALSTIGELIEDAGLTVHRKRRLRTPRSAPFSNCLAPNDVWTVDFKGWFKTGDGRRCDPLTLKDAHSRYLLRCQAVDRTDEQSVWPIFDAALREFGLPKAMRSDNGAPFASRAVGGLSRLSVRLIKAGVMPERIAPGKPQQNGRHERFHLTLKNETADPPAANRKAQQRRFDAFRRLYNEERPHEALKQTPPARHYRPSPRCYSGRLNDPNYPDHFLVRRVRSRGMIKWRGDLVFVSNALIGEIVGCEEQEDGIWSINFGPLHLGSIDHCGRLCVPRRKRGDDTERTARLHPG